MPYMAIEGTNPDNIETGIITENEILTINGKTKEGATTTTIKMATTNLNSKILKRTSMIAGVTTRQIQNTTLKMN